jgi:hypothetical protein
MKAARGLAELCRKLRAFTEAMGVHIMDALQTTYRS